MVSGGEAWRVCWRASMILSKGAEVGLVEIGMWLTLAEGGMARRFVRSKVWQNGAVASCETAADVVAAGAERSGSAVLTVSQHTDAKEELASSVICNM